MLQVATHQAKFTALNVNIATISFVGEPYASHWLQETASPFPLLLADEADVYRRYGLARSVWKSWGPKVLWYYGRAILQGKPRYGRRGDPNQLGGDFLVADGRILYAHPSKNPTDRPSVKQLLAAVGRYQAAV